MSDRRTDAAATEVALNVIRVAVGLFLISKGLGKLDWFMHPSLLGDRLTRWAGDETLPSVSRVYSGALVQATALFSRLVPLGEISAGVALVTGRVSRVAAILAALMILNFHLATGELLKTEFLTDANGFVIVAALIALAIAGSR